MAERVVVAGASGFVGRHLVDRLRQDKHDVVCGTRNPARASSVRPGFDWVRLDVDNADTLDAAMEGASTLVFLVHRMRDATDLSGAEQSAAERVVRCAEKAGLQRIVYLGAPEPGAGPLSEHIEARLETGRILRSATSISSICLRAGMVIGASSESWTIVRDLALRLPIMLLPTWLQSRSQPLWVGDVTEAIAHAVTDEIVGSHAFGLPGPEILTAEEILRRTAAHAGTRPLMIRAPVGSPGLSAHWIRLVTRADFSIARRLVQGMQEDLVCDGDGYWERMPAFTRTSFDDAVRQALAAESRLNSAGKAWETFARSVSRQA